MIYKDIEKYFKDEKGLEQLLLKYKEVFEKINYYEGLFKDGILSTPNETDDAMKQLGSIYSTLNVVATIADTQKKNIEDKYFVDLRNKKIKKKKGDKVIAAVLDKESSVHVALYRRVRNIFQAYRDSCDRLISICQSSLKSLDKEQKAS